MARAPSLLTGAFLAFLASIGLLFGLRLRLCFWLCIAAVGYFFWPPLFHSPASSWHPQMNPPPANAPRRSPPTCGRRSRRAAIPSGLESDAGQTLDMEVGPPAGRHLTPPSFWHRCWPGLLQQSGARSELVLPPPAPQSGHPICRQLANTISRGCGSHPRMVAPAHIGSRSRALARQFVQRAGL